MRLPFRRTQKPVAPRVYEPGADSPYVPRLGVWMEKAEETKFWCNQCGRPDATHRVNRGRKDCWLYVHEGCGAKLVAQLRREKER